MAVLQYPIFHSLNFHLKHLLPTIRVFIFSLRKRGCVQSRAAGTEIWIKAHFYGFLTSTAVSFQYSKRYVFFLKNPWKLRIDAEIEHWKVEVSNPLKLHISFFTESERVFFFGLDRNLFAYTGRPPPNGPLGLRRHQVRNGGRDGWTEGESVKRDFE